MKTEFESAPLSNHLTEAQFGELMAGPTRKADCALTPAEQHLLTCGQCAAEVDSLRESLRLFRDATTAYAGEQLRRMPPVVVPARSLAPHGLRPVVLATAAAFALAAFLPMQILHQRSERAAERQSVSANAATSFQHYAKESDEALLEDVDRATSGAVPDAMQTLADPMGTADLSIQKSIQRKD